MALLAEYELGCDALPLVDVAAAVPAADVELEFGPGEGDRPVFLVHVAGSDAAVDAVEAAFAETPFVGECTRVGEDDDRRRYRILPGTSMAEQLGHRIDDLDDLRALYELPVHVRRIAVTPTGWVQTGRFAERDAFDELRAFWQRNDVRFRLHRLRRVGADADGFGGNPDDGLTDAQREAIRTAHEMGYFDIPRKASLDDVAGELAISASSLSERLRRAQSHLIEAHVDDRPPSANDRSANALKGPHH